MPCEGPWTILIGAIMIEPVQGEGGVRIPPKGYLKNIREFCDEHGLLLVLDEVQTGMGRTGELFGYLHEGIQPDIMTLAKGLGNGFPVGAVAARPDVAEVFGPGSHASTFGGNPLAMAAASATLTIMIEQDIPGMCRETGAYLTQGLKEMMSLHSGIREIRSRGLMIGIQCDTDISSIPRDALEKGILLNVVQGSVLRLVPPLIITRRECDEAVEKIDKLLKEKGV